MKFNLKSCIVGMIIYAVGMGTVYATEAIKSAEFNSNKVVFNGKQLELSQPMISVVKQGEEATSNYMPVRAVLEAMGYEVEWDSINSVVKVRDKEKAMTYDTVVDNGMTMKEVVNSRLGIDVDSLRIAGKFDELNKMLDNSDPEMVCISMVDDYQTWLEGGECSFSDLWSAMYPQ